MLRLLSALIITLLFSSTSYAKETIYWYLAAAMAKPGKEVVKIFNSSKSSFEVQLITGGSGELLSKIVASGKGDLYTPASEFFLKKAVDKQIIKESRLLLFQTPVFALSKKGNGLINSFNDLGRKNIRIALGKPKTMALGNIYLNIEKKMDNKTAKAIRSRVVVDAINISQIVNYLRTEMVDAGILFDSTAKANRLEFVLIPEKYNRKINVSTAILTFSPNSDKPSIFLKYLETKGDIFRKYGFEFALDKK